METKEMKSIALEVLQNAENIADKDSVMAEMFSRGIPFVQLNKLYRSVGIENDLLVDPSVVKAEIEKVLSNAELDSFETYEALEAKATEIHKEVKGSTELQVLRRLKAFCKENEIEIPRKTRTSGPRKLRVGTLTEAVLNYTFNTPGKDMTKLGMYEAIRAMTNNAKNAFNQTNNTFPIAYGVRNGLDFEGTAEAVANMAPLNLEELIAADEKEKSEE